MNKSGIILFASLLTNYCLPAWVNAADVDEEIIVIGVTPTGGAGLPEGKIPYNVQSASAAEIDRSQSLDITDFLRHNLGSVTHNDAQGNPLQPDVQYRGYTASPLLGLAQGVAVYQNGARINEPLGDTVSWDLLPESAIHSIDLISGANPLFGLNTLGGALSVQMKDGFNSEGHNLEVYGGAFDRIVASAESGGNNGAWGYYANVHYFDEKGWRDLSASDAINFYGGLSWHGVLSELNLNVQRGDSKLVGNGAIPVELLAIDRDAIFTAPDRTENDLIMIGIDGDHNLTDNVKLSLTAFYRENDTDSFNGDASEFGIRDIDGMLRLVEEDDDDDDSDGDNGDDDDGDDDDNGDDDNGDDDNGDDDNGDGDDYEETYGNGDLSGVDIVAINNSSNRKQESYGTDVQLTFLNDLFGKDNQLILGLSYYKGKSGFNSETEIADLNRETRSTQGLGTGVFLEDARTNLETATETTSFYFMNTMDITERLALTLSGRLNNTLIDLADQSGERPELNGEHDYFRFNPAVGLTWQATDNLNVYGSYSESSRAPTPIELACNDSVFTRAVAAAREEGEDDDVEFECRLPNAFLADPPLEDVVTRSFEAGLRGDLGGADYHLGFFHSTNNDDILFQTTGRATGLFANVDKTRRLGFEGMLSGTTDKLDWFIAYTWLEATFEDDFDAVSSSNHPFAVVNDNGDHVIKVSAGDRIPGLPEHSLKSGADYLLFEKLSVGFDVMYNSSQVLRGDESNQLDTLDGYVVVNLRGRYRFNDNFELFARVTNLFDKDYESFGLLGEEPDEVAVKEFADFNNPRFVGPGAPRAGFVGIKLSI